MKKWFFAALSSLIFAASAAQAQETDVMEIVTKAIEAMYYQGGDQKARVEMSILDKSGRERNRQLILLRRNDGEGYGDQKYYVFFERPSDVKEMVFMALKNIDHADDRWLYLPALDLVKRIAASDERTSFVGSHFFYEDVSGRNIDEDKHELIDTTDEYYIIRSLPKNPEDVEFSSYMSRVDRTTFLPMKMEYKDKRDVVYRVYTVLTVEEIEGHPTITDVEVEDTAMGGKTVLHYSAVQYDVGLPENIFSERFLRRPPRQFLK